MIVRALLVAVSSAWSWAQTPEGAVPTPTPPSASPSPGAPVAAQTYVGSTACAQCHFNKFESYQNSPHSFKGDPRSPASRAECETCHGAASAHVQGGGGRGIGTMRNFGAAIPAEAKNAVHTRGPVAMWAGSAHADRKLACTSCHQIHGGNVPPGHYTLQAWHERFGTLTQAVDLTASGSVKADFSYTGTEKAPPPPGK